VEIESNDAVESRPPLPLSSQLPN